MHLVLHPFGGGTRKGSPNGSDAQPRGTGPGRPLRYPGSMPDSTRGGLKRAVPPQLQRLVRQRPRVHGEPKPRGYDAVQQDR